MPSNNILNIPFRRTVPLSLSTAIKQYISTKYDQHPNLFTQDLADIDELRRIATNAFEPHQSCIQRIQAYAAQLVWIGSKFPIDIGADFTWYPSLGYHLDTAVSQNNIRFELANILFNLAALYSQLAFFSPRGSPDGLKLASNYFCSAAGVFSHLKSRVITDMRSTVPEDMDTMTLESLEQLMLAQAQECFWHKAVKDGLKDASIAKLAIKVSDLYGTAVDYAIKSPSISSEWIHHMTAKRHHFSAAAQFRAACDCLEKRRYGEEVARLQLSLAQANDALKEARYINSVVLSDAQGLRNKVQEDLKRAEKDNDVIYLSPVPSAIQLKPIDRASMVAAKIPKEVSEPVAALSERSELGRPLFTKLVPYAVHLASSVYASRREETVTAIISEFEALTARIHSLLSSLNLPGSLQALEKPLGLAPQLLAHAEEIRQQHGISRLQQMVTDVDALKTADMQTYQDGISFLRSEADDDEKARRKYGTDRWSRPTSAEVAAALYNQAREVEAYLQKAETSDNQVRTKILENESLISLLAGTDRKLEDYVPSSRRVVMTPQLQAQATNLRNILNDISRLESRRKRKMESLRLKAEADAVNPDLHKEAARLERESPMQNISAAQFEALFDQRLFRYESDRATLTTEAAEQTSLLQTLTEAHTAFQSLRRGDTSTKEREQALQSLENAYFAYREIIQNLDVGRKFYNDLGGIVGGFRDQCRNLAVQRRAEAEQMEGEILNALPMAGLRIGGGGGVGVGGREYSEGLGEREYSEGLGGSDSAGVRGVGQLDGSERQVQREVQQSAQSMPDAKKTPRSTRTTRTTEPPLPAPVPVKPPVAVASNGHDNAPGPAGPRGGTWTPELGIKFGTTGTPNAKPTKGKERESTWDSSRGVKFG